MLFVLYSKFFPLLFQIFNLVDTINCILQIHVVVSFPVLDCSSNIRNSHYEVCGTDCGHTCASSIDASCQHTCSEGCFCDEGFVRSGGLCVPVEQCGCLYDGFYYNVRIKALFSFKRYGEHVTQIYSMTILYHDAVW